MNVWAGIVNDYLIGPYLLPTRLNGRCYRIFLEEVLPELLQEVPIGVRNQMWFQHDGAPAHFSMEVRNYLDATFGDGHHDRQIYRVSIFSYGGAFESPHLRDSS